MSSYKTKVIEAIQQARQTGRGGSMISSAIKGAANMAGLRQKSQPLTPQQDVAVTTLCDKFQEQQFFYDSESKTLRQVAFAQFKMSIGDLVKNSKDRELHGIITIDPYFDYASKDTREFITKKLFPICNCVLHVSKEYLEGLDKEFKNPKTTKGKDLIATLEDVVKNPNAVVSCSTAGVLDVVTVDGSTQITKQTDLASGETVTSSTTLLESSESESASEPDDASTDSSKVPNPLASAAAEAAKARSNQQSGTITGASITGATGSRLPGGKIPHLYETDQEALKNAIHNAKLGQQVAAAAAAKKKPGGKPTT